MKHVFQEFPWSIMRCLIGAFFFNYVLHGSLVRKKKMAAAMSCSVAKVRIKPIQPDRIRAAPPIAAPRAVPKVTKIVLIDIIVPRDSGACSRIKLVFAGKFMP